MHSMARFLVWIHGLNPKLFHYLEALEARVESQERELRALRWALKGEQLGHWDEEIDIQEWRSRTGKAAPHPDGELSDRISPD